MDSTAKDSLTGEIIACGIEVHRALGPGLLESAYEECLAYELGEAGHELTCQVTLPVHYKEVELDCGYRIDMLVDGEVIVELKTVTKLLPVHEAQLLTYLKLSGVGTGLLMNFNVPYLKDGIKRLVN
jgi:GxxExxY protein